MSGHAHNFYPYYVVINSDQYRLLEGNNRGLTGEQYVPDLCADRKALKFIRDNSEQPFFSVLPDDRPHLALQVPEDSLKGCTSANGMTQATKGGKGYLPHPSPRDSLLRRWSPPDGPRCREDDGPH
ncbi:MAG: hypothetical protein R3C01_14400 [Planctomycetaceae bacterium]